MTATQSLKLFEISKRYFQNDNDAKSFVEEIENVVDNKFISEKQNLASKSELVDLQNEIKLLRQETKTGFAELESKMKTEFNKQIIWLVGLMFALSGLIIAAIKVLFK